MTTQELLDDAEAKYHLILTGQAVRVFVDQNGERIEYTTANSARLAAYIRYLKGLLGEAPVRPGVIWL